MKQESALRPDASASCCGSRGKGASPPSYLCKPLSHRVSYSEQKACSHVPKQHARHTNAFLRTQASAFLQRYGSSEWRGPMYIPALRGLGRGDSWLPGSGRRGRVYEPASSSRAPSTASLHKGSCTDKKAGAFLHTCFSMYTALMPLSFPFERR